MDDRLTEMLSRYLDDDLTTAERADFDRLLKTDPQLRRDLDGARRLRRAVASIASGMEPPAELDRVMEPLRRSAPAPQRRIRPAYRWLGAAAAVVLGVTVTVEMVRRNPSPITVKPTRTITASSDDREIFELAPLPTAVPDDNRPVGATDHLLEEQPPPPAAPEPSALEVVGPLTADEFSIATENAPATLKRDKVLADAEFENRGASSMGEEATLRDGDLSAAPTTGRREKRDDEPADGDRSFSQSIPSAAGVERSGKIDTEAVERERQVDSFPISMLIDGIEVWAGASTICGVGRWPVVLDIQDGIIIDLRSTDGVTKDEAAGACRPAGIIGSAISGVSDGEVTAEIVVRTPQ